MYVPGLGGSAEPGRPCYAVCAKCSCDDIAVLVPSSFFYINDRELKREFLCGLHLVVVFLYILF
jgi:hypothetical protein